MRKPSLCKTVREGLLILATNPCAAEHLTGIQRYNIRPDELAKAKRAYEWVQLIANNRVERNSHDLTVTSRK